MIADYKNRRCFPTKRDSPINAEDERSDIKRENLMDPVEPALIGVEPASIGSNRR